MTFDLTNFALGTVFGIAVGSLQLIAIAMWLERRWKRGRS